MLKLCKITKEYVAGDTVVNALKGIDLQFRKSEFVSILGQSGCGKTTLLNIIGGLDRYTSGDLIIDGISTKEYKDVDWDTYRNIRVGFIFQSYNLIPHISILENVELALTLSGVGAQERQERAKEALRKVGLESQFKKKPNQLSGGQMQRVSIARALVNNPDIILADEPTGALDSNTSIQIMEILKEISKDKLIIMVTHNPDLAQKYSTRIIKLSDGNMVSDSMPYEGKEKPSELEEEKQEVTTCQLGCDKKQKKLIEKQKKQKLKKSSMSFFTALKLSFTNLMTKKGRTFMTSFAGSIGIIGVALVLAISNGFSGYIKDMQRKVLAAYPITIATQDIDQNVIMSAMMGKPVISDNGMTKYPDISSVLPFDPSKMFKDFFITNNITADYVQYVNQLVDKNLCSSIGYSYSVDMKVLSKINQNYSSKNGMSGETVDFGTLAPYQKVNVQSSMMSSIMGGMMSNSSPNINWQEMQGDKNFILSQFDILAGEFPSNKNQVAMVVSSTNQLNELTMASMGLDLNKGGVDFDKILGDNPLKFKLALNNAYYQFDNSINKFVAPTDLEELYNSDKVEDLTVSCILRQKEGASLTTLSTGIAYLPQLTQYVIQDGMKSDIVIAQNNTALPVLENVKFTPIVYEKRHFINELGGTNVTSMLNIYPTDFESKEKIQDYLDAWNSGKPTLSKIVYTDMSKMATDMISETVKIISIVLVCFASVSLIVSSVMIGIITYVSVVERTKEIGILRSLGARKFDISNVFNAETTLIGFTAGMIGVILTYLISIPINLIIYSKIQIATLCILNPLHAILMVFVSVFLTFIAGLIPASIASKKDPVIALRTE